MQKNETEPLPYTILKKNQFKMDYTLKHRTKTVKPLEEHTKKKKA